LATGLSKLNPANFSMCGLVTNAFPQAAVGRFRIEFCDDSHGTFSIEVRWFQVARWRTASFKVAS
jgi:hypothetical protein